MYAGRSVNQDSTAAAGRLNNGTCIPFRVLKVSTAWFAHVHCNQPPFICFFDKQAATGRMGSFCLTVSILLMMQMGLNTGYGNLDSFTDDLLREVMSRMSGAESPEEALGTNYDISDYGLHPPNPVSESQKQDETQFKDYKEGRGFEARRDELLGREPSIRDQEYLQHSSLFGHQYVQGGAGEGYQRLKPDGSMKNVQVVKTDGVLPAYCNPPDPCPLGYTAEDGCLEDFVNTAAFSREYQASQECMCDSEHMFDCPGATRENEIDALARSFDNEGLVDATLNRLIHDMQVEGEHKNLVAKKYFSHKPNPKMNSLLEGERLPVVAKKAPLYSLK